MSAFGAKEEWLDQHYGSHLELERLDRSHDFAAIMNMLSKDEEGASDRRDFLFWYIRRARDALDGWNVERHPPFVRAFGVDWLRFEPTF